MFRDSLGNVYKSLPHKPPQHHAKPTKKERKFGRSERKGKGLWRQKVKQREAAARAQGRKFPTYPC